jgi:hypothetical protein
MVSCAGRQHSPCGSTPTTRHELCWTPCLPPDTVPTAGDMLPDDDLCSVELNEKRQACKLVR